MEKVRPGSTLTDTPLGKVITILVVILVILIVIISGWFILFQSNKQDPSLDIIIGDPTKIKFIATTVIGDVKVKRGKNMIDLQVNDTLTGGDTITVGKSSECIIQMSQNAIIKITENSKVSLSGVLLSMDNKEENIITLISGTILSLAKKLDQKNIKIRTETGLVLVRGTKFSVYSKSKGETTIVVADGKIISKVRSRLVGEIASKAKKKEKLIVLEGISESIISSGKQVDISKQDQSEADQKIQSLISGKEFDNIDKLTQNLEKTIQKVSEEIKINPKQADKDKLEFLNKNISEDMIIDLLKAVKVSFIPTKETTGLYISIDNNEPSQIPISKMLRKDRKYIVTIRDKAGNLIFKDTFSFNQNTKIIVKKKSKQNDIEINYDHYR
ncbi:MAG: FecR family protein [Brevinematales bacterium]|nr:FecR family protein [Brevinematales bacterium]